MFIFFSTHNELVLAPADRFDEKVDWFYPEDGIKNNEKSLIGRKTANDEISNTSTIEIAGASSLSPSTQGLETEPGIQQN